MSKANASAFGEALKRVYALERKRDVYALVRMLDNPLERTPVLTVRAAAAAALGRLGHPVAGEALVAAACDPSHEVRVEAIRALGSVRYKGATLTLIDALNDDCLKVRRAAAISLGAISSEEAIPVLRDALRSSDAWTRLYAAESLASIGDPTLRELLPKVHSEARFAFSRRKRWRRLERVVGNIRA